MRCLFKFMSCLLKAGAERGGRVRRNSWFCFFINWVSLTKFPSYSALKAPAAKRNRKNKWKKKRDVLDISNFRPQVQKEHRQGAGGGQPVRGEEGGRRLAVLRHPDADDVAGAAPGLHGVLDGLRLRPGLGVRRQQLWVRSYARTGAVSISLT